MAVPVKGMLFEYGLSVPPLALIFDFNPQQISRSRTVTIKMGEAPGNRTGYDFLSPLDTPRVAQGVEQAAESFSIDILLDATDKMNEGDPIAAAFGVQPQIDTLRSMVEPKSQGPMGLQTLAARRVAEERVRLHLCERCGTDETLGLRRSRHVHAHDVRLAEQLVHRDQRRP